MTEAPSTAQSTAPSTAPSTGQSTGAETAERTVTLEVLRYHPDRDDEPAFESFEVPYREDWVVLDALNYLKDEVDGSLTYRWSCRMGVCGSCGMMVNGVPRLTCNVFLRDFMPGPIRVEPLRGFPVERDLVVVLDDFMDKLTAVKPWMIREVERPLEDGEYRQSPSQLAGSSATATMPIGWSPFARRTFEAIAPTAGLRSPRRLTVGELQPAACRSRLYDAGGNIPCHRGVATGVLAGF